MKHWQKLVRWQEWYDTKLPLIVMVGYYSFSQYPEPIWETAFRIFIYGAGLLAFGYLVNDISDKEPDRLVGKKREVHNLSRKQVLSVVAIIVSIMIFALWPYFLRRPCIVGVSFMLSVVAAAAYSLHPFRLKERGWLGLITASTAQRSIPAFVAITCLDVVDTMTLAMLLVYFLNGLRYIVMHQIIDAENDRAANLQTYMLTGNRLSASANYLNNLLLGEIIILIIIPLSMPLQLRWVGFMFWPFGLYWIVQLFIRGQKAHPLTYDRMPLQIYYLVIWPASLIIVASLLNPLAWTLLPMELIWKRRLLSQKLRGLKILFV